MRTDRLLYDYGPHVRVVSRANDSPAGCLVVQTRGHNSVSWDDVRTFDCMSDDYAHGNARDYAQELSSPADDFDRYEYEMEQQERVRASREGFPEEE